MNPPKPAPPPQPVILEGRYCRLEPIGSAHSVDLFAAVCGENADARHQYLMGYPPRSQKDMDAWVEAASIHQGDIYSAVIDKDTGRCGGRQALMRIRPEHGSIEVGSILWGEGVARTRLATEALFLTARHIFDDLGYRRFEWKCNAENQPSRRAAIRFGFKFEGIFRQDMIVKNENRDTAWFSILDGEWPDLKAKYEAWLAPENFDAAATAKTKLATPRS